jgi:hypothetical protein
MTDVHSAVHGLEMKSFKTPDAFHGDRTKWRDFKFMFCVWLGAVISDELVSKLEEAETSTVPIPPQSDALRILDRKVYAYLVMLTRGPALEIMKSVPSNQGFESWRQLCREFEVKAVTSLGMFQRL